MIQFRIYIRKVAYKQADNTIRAISDWSVLNNFVNVGQIKYSAQDEISADNWHSGTVSLVLSNPKTSAEYGSIYETLPTGWGWLRSLFDSCGSDSELLGGEIGLVEVIISAQAKANPDWDSYHLQTFEDFMGYNIPDLTPDTQPLENETAIFGGFVDVKNIVWDEIEQKCTLTIAGYDQFPKLILSSKLTPADVKYKSLENIITEIKGAIPILDDAIITPNPDYQDPPLGGKWLHSIVGATMTVAEYTRTNRGGEQRWIYGFDTNKFAVQRNLPTEINYGYLTYDTSTGLIAHSPAGDRAHFDADSAWSNIAGYFAPICSRIPKCPSGWAKMPKYPTGWFGSSLAGPVWGAGLAWYGLQLVNQSINAGILLRVQDEDDTDKPNDCYIDWHSFDDTTGTYTRQGGVKFYGPSAQESNPYLIFWFYNWDRFLIVSPNRDRVWLYPGTYGATDTDNVGQDDWAKQPEEITGIAGLLKNISVVSNGDSNTARIYGERDNKRYYCDIHWTAGASGECERVELKPLDVEVSDLPPRLVQIGSGSDYELWYYDEGKQAIVCRDNELALKYLYKVGLENDYVALGADGSNNGLDTILIITADSDMGKYRVLTHGGSPVECLPNIPDGDNIAEILDKLAHAFGCFWTITPQKKLIFRPKFENRSRGTSPNIIIKSGKSTGTQADRQIRWSLYKHYADKIRLTTQYGTMGTAEKDAYLFEKSFDLGDVYHNTDVGKYMSALYLDIYGKHRRELTIDATELYDELLYIYSIFGSNWWLVRFSVELQNTISSLKLVERLDCDTYYQIIEMLPCFAVSVEWDKNAQGWIASNPDTSMAECYCPSCATAFNVVQEYISDMLNLGYYVGSCSGEIYSGAQDSTIDVEAFLFDHLDDHARSGGLPDCHPLSLRETIEWYLNCYNESCGG